MADPVQIGFDIAAESAGLVLLPLLWLALFLIAWEDRRTADRLGFGRTTFWLLVATAVLSTYAEIPLLPYAGDLLGINVGGGLLPVLLSALLFARFAPPARRTLPAFAAALGGIGSASFAAVVTLPGTVGPTVAVVALSVAGSVLTALLPARWGGGRPLTAAVALSATVLVVTYLYSASEPLEGIVETFPAYLIAPIGAGAVAAAVGPLLFGDEVGLAAPLAYVAGTFGVLIGADLLRQPPLYGGGGAAFYVIGGANVQDLVYLSGLTAFVTAYALVRWREGVLLPHAPPAEPAPARPLVTLREAVRAALSGDAATAIRSASAASRAAAERARRLLGLPPAPPDRPWDGLGAPGWVVADQANLDAVARDGPFVDAEAYRAVQTARGMIAASRHLGGDRFAPIRSRCGAAAVDFALVTVPVAALWFVLLAGGLGTAGGGIAFPLTVSAYADMGLGFLYFALLGQTARGTIGRRLFRLRVVDRAGRPIGLVASFVREGPKLIPLSVVGLFGPIAAALLVHAPIVPPGFGGLPLALVLAFVLGIGVLTVGVSALVGIVGIALTPDRQRIGDLMASTWVLRAGP
ncbi:MAG: RDD family protein [Thermoplasmata archaeon]